MPIDHAGQRAILRFDTRTFGRGPVPQKRIDKGKINAFAQAHLMSNALRLAPSAFGGGSEMVAEVIGGSGIAQLVYPRARVPCDHARPGLQAVEVR